MSTEIRDESSTYGPHFLDDLGGGRVNLLARRICHEVTATMSRAEFLAAVETECGVRVVPSDAIVIDRAELPEVEQIGTHHYRVGTESFDPQGNANRYREWAREFLALAEYLAAPPPVPPVSDEDVETLAGLVRAEVLDRQRDSGEFSDWPTIARRLLATGKVTVKTP